MAGEVHREDFGEAAAGPFAQLLFFRLDTHKRFPVIQSLACSGRMSRSLHYAIVTFSLSLNSERLSIPVDPAMFTVPDAPVRSALTELLTKMETTKAKLSGYRAVCESLYLRNRPLASYKLHVENNHTSEFFEANGTMSVDQHLHSQAVTQPMNVLANTIRTLHHELFMPLMDSFRG